MKKTYRDDWRVIVTIAPRSISDFGFDGLGDIAGAVTSGPIEVAIAPRRLGDFGFVSMGDRLASNDVEGDYRRRCEELLAALLEKPHVREGRVVCTETHTCSHCGYGWEVLTAEEAADPANRQDEHTVEGEPVCCEAAINEFRAERGSPALADPSVKESADRLTRLFAPTQALREDEPAEEPALTVFRASHDSIVMGLYTTREAAQAHCEAKVQQEEPAGSIRHLSWSTDDIGDGAEYELHITPAGTGELIRGTGYVVTPLEVASEYDEEADE